mgnify:CR=1 FL=1
MITKSDFEQSWQQATHDTWCDWCGASIWRHDLFLAVECGHRCDKFYCGEGCEGNHRDRINSRLEAVV